MNIATHLLCSSVSILGSFAAAIAPARAQDHTPSPPVTTSGFVDVFYSANLGQPADHANTFRNFDAVEHRFDLALTEIVIQKSAAPIGFRIDAGFGSVNDMVQGGLSSTHSILQQAYVTAVVPLGTGLTVDAGKFVTHMGYEVIESKDNWNYSRSFLFSWAIPYYHFGVRAAYAVLPALTVTGHLCNGWNNLAENNDGKTFGLSLLATPSEHVTLISGWIGGREQADSSGAGMRNVLDLTVIYRPTENMSFALNGDYGTEKLLTGMVVWKGVAAYGRYAFCESSAIALRGEIYDDPDGATTGIAHRLGEITATVEHSFAGLLLRAEYRHDWSSENVFDNSDGAGVAGQQNTITVGAVVSF